MNRAGRGGGRGGGGDDDDDVVVVVVISLVGFGRWTGASNCGNVTKLVRVEGGDAIGWSVIGLDST